MKILTLLLVLFVSLPLQAGEILKSPNDARQYQYLQLANGLKVLLVSDPETDKAAAALTVGVGSTSNPPGREGLAHFLEHMLFMGTEKYPDVDDYSDFIKKHGGMDNAFTAANQTTYFFDIKPEALEPALDRFAQFFIAPLMDARYVAREKNAVESEYQLKLKDDDRRIGAAQKQGFNPASPYAAFAVGNLETLADRPGHKVRDDLLAFYRRHYSANIMGLAVVGREPLPVLRRWVMEKFSAVPNRQARRMEPTAEQKLYLPSQLPLTVDAVPLKKLHKLELDFLLPATKAHYREMPLYYLAHFIGDEGRGSLYALLRDKGWLTALTASGSALDDTQSLFTVEMELTEAGMAHQEEILQAFFAYVALLRDQGIEAWRYDELARKKALDFRFKEKGDPADYAVELSGNLLDYPPEEVLVAGKLPRRFDADLIRRLLDELRPDNLALTRVQQGLATNRVEKYYGTPYALHPGRPKAPSAPPAELLSALALPKPNPYLPDRVELKPIAQRQAIPKPLETRQGFTLWHQQDDQFGVPRGAFAASFEFPQANDSPRHAVTLALLVALVDDKLNPETYPASLAGLGYSLSRTNRGLLLLIYGYDDKQPLLLEKIVQVLAKPRFDPKRFEVLKAKLARDLRNKALDRPFRQVIDAMNRALVKPSWSPKAKLAALEELTLDDLQTYADGLFHTAELKLLAYGNLTADEARQMEGRLRQGLLAQSSLRPVADPQVRRLPVGQTERLRHPVDHPDSVVASYYQGEDEKVQENALWRLLAQVIKNDFFTALRTEQQLGYLVAAVPLERERLPGLLFLVQSSAVSARELEKRIDAYVAGIGDYLARLTPEAFAAYKAGLKAELLKKDQNTMERALRYLDNIDREQTTFDFRRRLAQALEEVTLEQLRAFYKERLLERPRHLVAYSPGTRFPEEGTASPQGG